MNPIPPIEPFSPRSPEISVTAPVSAALERVKEVLFRPFDLGKWFVVGFCAWLALLGEHGGLGGNFNFGSPGRHNGGDFREGFEHVKAYVLDNLVWLVPLAAVLLLLVVALVVLFTWLSSRGKFLFLRCVARNQADVVAPWNEFAREANSLFWFRLGLGLVSALLTLPLVALLAVLILGMVRADAVTAVGAVLGAAVLLGIVAIGTGFYLIRKLTMDFVVPIMFLRRASCRQGWGELRSLFPGNVGNFILYFLFQLVLGLVIGVLVLIVVIATCCIAGCFLAIPYFGTVLLLPVHVFNRAYSLYYLAQFGREFDVFPNGPAGIPGNEPPFPSASGMAAA